MAFPSGSLVHEGEPRVLPAALTGSSALPKADQNTDSWSETCEEKSCTGPA